MARRLIGPLLVTAGAAVALAGTFLPWVRSGAAERTSFEVFDLVERLGFSPDGAVGWALRVWPIVPLLLVLAAVLQWWRLPATRYRLVRRGVPVVAAVYPAATAISVWRAPALGVLRLGPGPATTVAGCGLIVVGVAVEVATFTRATRRAR